MEAVKLVDTKSLTHDQWLTVRNTGVTGSRIAAIMGKNPYETPLSVYLRMKGMIDEKEQTDQMYFGVALEGFIAEEFAKRTELKVEIETHMLQHPVYEFMLANVDRIVTKDGKKGILECKNVSAFQADNWKVGAPEMYVMQLQWYLGITGHDFGYLCALVGGQKFVYYEYRRDDELIAEMQRVAADFWFNHIVEDVQPDISADDGGVLDELYSDSKSELVVEMAGENVWMIQKAKANKLTAEEAEAEYKRSVNEIKSLMGNAETLHYEGTLMATWKANKNGVRAFKLYGGNA
jgi:putative phage-type endonuclease